MILVVGATGQLGACIVGKLADQGKSVRAFARESSDHAFLRSEGVEIAFGDLRDRASLFDACKDVETLIATANTAIPRKKGDSFEAVDGQGYRDLIEAASSNGVKHIIYTSALSSPGFDRLPIGRQKRLTETAILNSGIPYTIFRADVFMDIAFPMLGSDMPVRGAAGATVKRPFWFTSRFFESVRNSISEKGVALISGDGSTRHTYICIDDVAAFHVKAVDNPRMLNKTFEIGGPESLSQNDVVAIFEKVLGKKLKRKSTPPIAYKLASAIFRPFSPAASNIMGINYYSATAETNVDMLETARLFDVKLTTAEEFIRSRAAMPDGI